MDSKSLKSKIDKLTDLQVSEFNSKLSEILKNAINIALKEAIGLLCIEYGVSSHFEFEFDNLRGYIELLVHL